MQNKSLFIALFLSLWAMSLWAQEESLSLLDDNPKKVEYVRSTFKTTRLVNLHTIEMPAAGVLDVRINHKFGDVAMGEPGMWGLYSLSDVRLACEMGVIDRLSVGLGRSKMQGWYDVYAKGNILRQRKSGNPISLVGFASAGFRKQPIQTQNFAYRWSYVAQLIAASKIGPVSLLFSPTYTHRNFAEEAGSPNDIISFGLGARVKITSRFVFVIDYLLQTNKYLFYANRAPLGIGLELETGGHVFSINFTNARGIIEQEYIPYTQSSWLKGGTRLAFGISRVFQVYQPKK